MVTSSIRIIVSVKHSILVFSMVWLFLIHTPLGLLGLQHKAMALLVVKFPFPVVPGQRRWRSLFVALNLSIQVRLLWFRVAFVMWVAIPLFPARKCCCVSISCIFTLSTSVVLTTKTRKPNTRGLSTLLHPVVGF